MKINNTIVKIIKSQFYLKRLIWKFNKYFIVKKYKILKVEGNTLKNVTLNNISKHVRSY